MNVLYPYASWDTGGPLVLHSCWWIEAHWGRAFEIQDFRVGRQDGASPLYGQSAVVMRKRGVAATVAELERLEPGEPREWAAVRQDATFQRRALVRLRGELDTVYTATAGSSPRRCGRSPCAGASGAAEGRPGASRL